MRIGAVLFFIDTVRLRSMRIGTARPLCRFSIDTVRLRFLRIGTVRLRSTHKRFFMFSLRFFAFLYVFLRFLSASVPFSIGTVPLRSMRTGAVRLRSTLYA
jgi:hypothetical protein